jgi:probable rRNA maturation factor
MKAQINYFTENVQFVLPRKVRIRKWIKQSIKNEGKCPGVINFIFCDDQYLVELNIKYLKKNTLTDIITFPDDLNGQSVGGDLYISFERIKENAVKYKQDESDELLRVMIHGVLHLLGYNDETIKERERMRTREDFYILLFKLEFAS